MSSVVPLAAQRRPGRSSGGGFTLTELMIVLAIIGVLAAASAPSFTKDNRASAGRDLASDVARELQKCRSEALSTGLSVRAFIFSNRVELRPYVAGATPGAAPRVPTVDDPLARSLPAAAGLTFVGVVVPGAAMPAGATLSASVHADIDFSSQGGAQFVGQAIPTGATIYLQNGNLPPNSPDYDFRIDITALTAFVSGRAN